MAKTKKSLRDKYKPAKVKDLKAKVENEDEIITSGYGGDSNFLKIEDGKSNKFKLFPAHEGADFYKMRRRYWVQIEGENSDPVKRTVLDSKVHGGTEKDIIDEYIKYIKESVKDADKIKVVTDWKTGLAPQNHFIAYALKLSKNGNEFGMLEMKKTVRDDINKEAFVEDEDEPIEVDPYTDLDEGLPILIKYNSKPNKKKNEDYYTTTVSKKPYAVTDEELELFDKAKSLNEIYDNVYGLSDFELALEGLKFFDLENEIDLFDDEGWLEIVEEVKNQYDESDEDDEDDEDSEEESEDEDEAEEVEEEDEDSEEDEEEDESEEEEDEDEDEDELEELDRKGLKAYIKENGISVKVKKSWSDDDIREAIREEGEESEEEDEDDEEEELTLEQIKARLKKKKK